MLANELRLERTFAVAGRLDADFPAVGEDSLPAPAVAVVAARWLDVAWGVTDVVAHLGTQRSLNERFLLAWHICSYV